MSSMNQARLLYLYEIYMHFYVLQNMQYKEAAFSNNTEKAI